MKIIPLVIYRLLDRPVPPVPQLTIEFEGQTLRLDHAHISAQVAVLKVGEYLDVLQRML